MNPEEVKNLKLNYIVNTLDGALFGLGISFASFSTVIPLFVSTLTDSAILIGLITAVHVMGWQLPQLLMAQSVSRMARYKPMVLWLTIHERVPFLGLALVALFYQQIGAVPAILLTFLMLVWQGFGAGFTANPWQSMVGKVIPAEYLATFFGIQSSAANLLGSGGAVLAGLILERQVFPNNYALCFFIAFVTLMVAYIPLSLTRESPRLTAITREAQMPLRDSIRTILKQDMNFNWFLITRTIVQFGTMAFSFYTVYAAQRLQAGEYALGILTSVLMISQMIANPALGWLADRWSRKGVLEIGAVAIFASALIARFAPTVEWMYLSMALAGMANTAFWTVSMAYVLQFGDEHTRPTYIGLSNTLIAPATIAAPLLGGWLADASGYAATFLLAAVAGLSAAAVFHFFVHDPKKVQPILAEVPLTGE